MQGTGSQHDGPPLEQSSSHRVAWAPPTPAANSPARSATRHQGRQEILGRLPTRPFERPPRPKPPQSRHRLVARLRRNPARPPRGGGASRPPNQASYGRRLPVLGVLDVPVYGKLVARWSGSGMEGLHRVAESTSWNISSYAMLLGSNRRCLSPSARRSKASPVITSYTW